MAHSHESHTKHLNGEDNTEIVNQHSPPLIFHDDDDNDDENSFAYAMQLALSIVIPMSVQTAAELGVFDVINRAGPGAKLSADEIASVLRCNNPEAPAVLDRLLRLLASHSVVRCSVVPDDECRGPGSFRRVYGLAPVARFYAPSADGGSSLGSLIKMFNDKVCLESWSHLTDSIMEGGNAAELAHGSHAFEYSRSDQRFNEIFNEAMVNHTTIAMNKILECYKGFEKIHRLVDVGGGLGTTLKLITSKYHHIHGINFDLPHVIQHAPSYPGVEHVGGNMFESVPKGDAIFMKWILHDWSDERCLKLLKNCYDATPDEGKVIVVEAVYPITPNTSIVMKPISQFDVLMMHGGGKERSEQEFNDLAKSAGFSGVRYESFVCNLCVMEFFK